MHLQGFPCFPPTNPACSPLCFAQHAVRHAREAGIRAVVFNSRGTSESPVTTAQFYSASYTEDLR